MTPAELKLTYLGELFFEDREEILAADKLCFPDDYPPDFDSYHWWTITDPTGAIASYASAIYWEPDDSVFVARMGTLLQYRGGGLQRRLISAIVRRARKIGAAAVRTYVMPWNAASANNFTATGFKVYDPKEGDPWVGEGVLYLRRRLKP